MYIVIRVLTKKIALYVYNMYGNQGYVRMYVCNNQGTY